MNIDKRIVKHPFIACYVFGISTMFWAILSNISPLVIAPLNIAISREAILYTMMVLILISNIFLYRCIPSNKMCTYELILNSVLPVQLYFTLKMFEYNLAIAIISVLLIVWLSFTLSHIQKKYRKRQINMTYFVRHIAAACALLLIIPSYIYYKYEKPSQEYVSVKKNESYSITQQEDKAKKLKASLHECEWEKLSIDEKSTLLFEVVEVESINLGISAPKLKVENLDKQNHKGSYNHKEKVITLNSYYLVSDSIEGCLTTVVHELYHAFENSVIDIMRQLDENEYKGNAYFERADGWKEAKESYQNDSQTLQGYKSNLLESDARFYAQNALKERYGF